MQMVLFYAQLKKHKSAKSTVCALMKSLQAQLGPTIALCWMMMIFWETMAGTYSV